jgi:hypothetical protein
MHVDNAQDAASIHGDPNVLIRASVKDELWLASDTMAHSLNTCWPTQKLLCIFLAEFLSNREHL